MGIMLTMHRIHTACNLPGQHRLRSLSIEGVILTMKAKAHAKLPKPQNRKSSTAR